MVYQSFHRWRTTLGFGILSIGAVEKGTARALDARDVELTDNRH